jgi:hypothetical protein
MSTSRENLDIQRAAQVIAQTASRADLPKDLSVVFVPEETVLPGYIAYNGDPVVPFRLTREDWPVEEEVPEDAEVPDNCIGVFEPERPDQSFWPIEEYIANFDPDDYGSKPMPNGFLPLRLV